MSSFSPNLIIDYLRFDYKRIRQNMINLKSSKMHIKNEEQQGNFLQKILNQIRQINIDISDQNCTFIIQKSISQEHYIILQILAIPKIGFFQDIQFQICVIVPESNSFDELKVISRYRIFHPNIDFITKQIIYPQLIKYRNLLPQQKFQFKFPALLKHLKYILIQPNLNMIPNNPINNKASWNIRYNKHNYKKLISLNSSFQLQKQYESLGILQIQDKSCVNYICKNLNRSLNVKEFNYQEYQEVNLLQKKITILDLHNEQTNQQDIERLI